jgi:hypothetical protein
MGDSLTEADLRSALRELSADAPTVAEVLPRRQPPTARVRWIAPLAAAAVVLLAAGLTAGLLHRGSSRSPVGEVRSRDLVGIEWRMTRIDGAPTHGPGELRIASDGHFSQNLDTCSSLQGSAVVTGATVTFSRTSVLTDMCPATGRDARPERADAAAVQRALTGSLTWSVTGRRLTLEKPSGPSLHYTRVVALPEPPPPASSTKCLPPTAYGQPVAAYVGLTQRAAKALARTRHEHLQFFGGAGKCIVVVTFIPQHSIGVVFDRSRGPNGRFPAAAVITAARPVR